MYFQFMSSGQVTVFNIDSYRDGGRYVYIPVEWSHPVVSAMRSQSYMQLMETAEGLTDMLAQWDLEGSRDAIDRVQRCSERLPSRN